MATPEYLNNLERGDVLEKNGLVNEQLIPYWIVTSLDRDNNNNITYVHLKKYEINNRTVHPINIAKSVAELARQFTFLRHDDLPAGGGRKRRSKRVRRKSRKSRRARKSRRH